MEVSNWSIVGKRRSRQEISWERRRAGRIEPAPRLGECRVDGEGRADIRARG
jgi:hypothetical protein